MLGAIHAVAATWFGIPYLQLEDEEAERLGKAVERVLRFHGVRVMTPAMQAYWSLGSAGAAIYGRRIAYYNQLKAAEAGSGSAPSRMAPTTYTNGSATDERPAGQVIDPELQAGIERGEI